jgi:glycolate oxidase subunit GlcD
MGLHFNRGLPHNKAMLTTPATTSASQSASMVSASQGRVLPAAFLAQLAQTVGPKFVLTAPSVLQAYQCDACTLLTATPAAVVLPNSTQQVAAIVKACVQFGIPYVARGAGTGLSGGALALDHSVIIGLNRLNKLLNLDHRMHRATVQTGLVNAWLTKAAEPFGLFYAPDPSSQSACTLGGNIAENAGGIHCLKYGVTTDHVLGLTWVTPEGEVLALGGTHRRGHGLNLTGLMVGSEGTLGIATEATLQLLLKPANTVVILAAFAQTVHATQAVSQLIQQPIQPSALEFMDAATVTAVNQAFPAVNLPAGCQALLLIELDGGAVTVRHRVEATMALLQQHQCQTPVRVAHHPDERAALWKARKGAVAAYGRIAPAFYLHDAVIPRSQLTQAIEGIAAIGQQFNVPVASVFHAGDGNLHPHIFYDPQQPEQLPSVMAAGDAIIKLCVGLGGTLSGEHGIGVEKQAYMSMVYPQASLDWMLGLKQTLDPHGLANPNKILPQRRTCGEVHAPMYGQALLDKGLWV